MKTKYFMLKNLSIFCLFILLSSCNNNGTIPKDSTGKEDFQAFYEAFHKDTIFQFQRIEFPLGGLNSEGLPTTWTEENWKWHRPIELPADQHKIIHQGSDVFVKERILIQNAFLMERNFSYDDKAQKWLLTYYAEPHFPQNTNRLSNSTESSQIDSINSDHPDMPIEE